MNNPLPPTSQLRERNQQQKWQLRQQYAGLRVFNHLLDNEFLPALELRERLRRNLDILLGFCALQVPYYRRLFKKNKIVPRAGNSLELLQEIPILSKTGVQNYSRDLCAKNLPKGEAAGYLVKTSGTTGQPVTVVQSVRCGSFFSFLKQRELRWFRFDPGLIQAAIRSAGDLPPKPDGRPIELGETSQRDYWSNVGRFFETGPFFGFMWTNPIEAQMEWLTRISPAYLIGQAADLEHLALAYADRKTPASLKGILAISQELTEDMEERIKDTFKAPVYVNYGLNEVGIVASRCPEGGRYHVHTEHCFVEIVDDRGKPCQPGQRGKIIVTALNNAVMPLIRYDTDDLAEVAEGPCPCGRTLPSFGRVHGRYRRLAALPPGTMDLLSAIIRGIDDAPKDIIQDLRQYSLHQFKNGAFELSIVATGPLGAVFHEKIMEKWHTVESAAKHPLKIKEVDSIPRPQGGKFQKFTSEFMPTRQFIPGNDRRPR